MEVRADIDDLSLLGGPLHRLGARLGLVRNGTNTIALGLALGVAPWLVMVALSLVEGHFERIFSLSVLAGHVRMLIAIPLAFLCETWLEPRVTAFVRSIATAGVVTVDAVPALHAHVARTLRWKDSWLGDAVCLLAAVLAPFAGAGSAAPGTTSALAHAQLADGMTMTGAWYWFVCLTIFRFVLYRWILRLAAWAWFLWRLSRMQLRLVPTHPDLAGGIGNLEVVHVHFLPLVFAISAVEAAGFAEAIGTGAMPFEACYPAFALILFLDALLFIGPMFFFSPRLWICRANGYVDYTQLASTYVRGFDRKWLREPPGDEPLLGTSDIQSLADLANSVNIVRNMRFAPLGVRTVRDFALVALLPAVPLLLLKFPAAELAARFFARLSGI